MIFYCTLRKLLNSNGVVYVQQRGFGSFVRLHIQQQCSSQFIITVSQHFLQVDSKRQIKLKRLTTFKDYYI